MTNVRMKYDLWVNMKILLEVNNVTRSWPWVDQWIGEKKCLRKVGERVLHCVEERQPFAWEIVNKLIDRKLIWLLDSLEHLQRWRESDEQWFVQDYYPKRGWLKLAKKEEDADRKEENIKSPFVSIHRNQHTFQLVLCNRSVVPKDRIRTPSCHDRSFRFTMDRICGSLSNFFLERVWSGVWIIGFSLIFGCLPFSASQCAIDQINLIAMR